MLQALATLKFSTVPFFFFKLHCNSLPENNQDLFLLQDNIWFQEKRPVEHKQAEEVLGFEESSGEERRGGDVFSKKLEQNVLEVSDYKPVYHKPRPHWWIMWR